MYAVRVYARRIHMRMPHTYTDFAFQSTCQKLENINLWIIFTYLDGMYGVRTQLLVAWCPRLQTW